MKRTSIRASPSASQPPAMSSRPVAVGPRSVRRTRLPAPSAPTTTSWLSRSPVVVRTPPSASTSTTRSVRWRAPLSIARRSSHASSSRRAATRTGWSRRTSTDGPSPESKRHSSTRRAGSGSPGGAGGSSRHAPGVSPPPQGFSRGCDASKTVAYSATRQLVREEAAGRPAADNRDPMRALRPSAARGHPTDPDRLADWHPLEAGNRGTPSSERSTSRSAGCIRATHRSKLGPVRAARMRRSVARSWAASAPARSRRCSATGPAGAARRAGRRRACRPCTGSRRDRAAVRRPTGCRARGKDGRRAARDGTARSARSRPPCRGRARPRPAAGRRRPPSPRAPPRSRSPSRRAAQRRPSRTRSG